MKRIICLSISFLVGLICGLLIADKLFQPGCILSIHFSPPSIETNCPNPYEIQFSFGRAASSRSLRSALEIIEEKTRGKGQARIYVHKSVLEADFASNMVNPPTGSQGTISLINQLLAEAGASDKVDICLVRSGGFIIRLR
jgi:hypothetical protein